jgi:hypothetical protein
MVGTIGSYEEYSDVILALMRYKKATTISRSGYNYDPAIVPGLSPEDPVGTPRKQGAAPVPTDQLERLAYLQSQPQTGGYLDAGNYGAPGTDAKGAMPGQSEITIVMTVSKDLQAPDPEATLAAAGSASAGAATATTVSAPSGPGAFGAPGGPPPGPPPGAIGASRGGGRKPSSAADGD